MMTDEGWQRFEMVVNRPPKGTVATSGPWSRQAQAASFRSAMSQWNGGK